MPKSYRTYSPRNVVMRNVVTRNVVTKNAPNRIISQTSFKQNLVMEYESQPYIPSQPSYNNHVVPTKCRYYGIVKVYFLDRGYGFIRSDRGQEFYFKAKDGFVLRSGMKVGFELEGNGNGQKAVRVTYDGKQVS